MIKDTIGHGFEFVFVSSVLNGLKKSTFLGKSGENESENINGEKIALVDMVCEYGCLTKINILICSHSQTGEIFEKGPVTGLKVYMFFLSLQLE